MFLIQIKDKFVLKLNKQVFALVRRTLATQTRILFENRDAGCRCFILGELHYFRQIPFCRYTGMFVKQRVLMDVRNWTET